MKFYVITNNSNYLSLAPNNSIITTAKLALAQRFTEEKAKNVIKNLPNTLKNIGYHVEEIEEEDIPIIKRQTNFNEKEKEILEKVKDFEDYLKEIGQIRDEYAKRLSKVDKQIQDILHAAEFYTLNACEGYKLYKLLHEKRVERRELKNFIEKVGFIEGHTGKELANHQGSKSIIGYDNRKYEPRALKELFERRK